MAYAAQSDLALSGVPSAAFGTLSTAQLDAALAYGAQLIDGHLGGRYKLPLAQPWPPEIVTWNAILGAWQAINVRGFNPASAGERALQARAEGVLALLAAVQRQAYHPQGIVEASSPSPAYPSPLVASEPMQGWIPDPSLAATPNPSGVL